jgi:hypothetical protein
VWIAAGLVVSQGYIALTIISPSPNQAISELLADFAKRSAGAINPHQLDNPQGVAPTQPYAGMDPALASAFADFAAAGWGLEVKRGPPAHGGRPMTREEHNAKRQCSIEAKQRRANIAVLDFETDPFNATRRTVIKPFLAVIFSERFAELGVATDPKYPGCIVIWEQNHEKLIEQTLKAIISLPEKFTIYAHNGGKFDYMFFVHKLRGNVAFKGRAIMSAMVEGHALRDSLHIIPEALANIQKETFDYRNMQRKRRAGFRDQIIQYCVSDCRNLFVIVKDFIGQFGPKLTVGQAALTELRKDHEITKFTEHMDSTIRPFYVGGRVQCIEGAGLFEGNYKVYDINSSYPNVMAKFQHPVGGFWDWSVRRGDPTEHTFFIDLDCDNRDALLARDENGSTTSEIKSGNFKTTIHEYNIAIKYGLISNVKINKCYDCSKHTDFSKFVIPRYQKRQLIKAEMADMKARGNEGSQAWFDLKRDDIFNKIILNSAYGKTGQNPRKFKDHYLTDPNGEPPAAWFRSLEYLSDDDKNLYSLPAFEDPQYWIWEKPAPRHSYNNVGVAASVTGAARAVLLEAKHHAVGAIYCDTDSLICERLTGPLKIHPTELGAWHLDDEVSKVIIAGKKLYGIWHRTPKRRSPRQLEWGMSADYTIKAKGSTGLTWPMLLDMLDGQSVHTRNRAPTLDRYGVQRYIDREIRATGVNKCREIS